MPRADRTRALTASVIGGDRKGVVVCFPTEWLLFPLDREEIAKDASKRDARLHIPAGFLDGVRQVLAMNLNRSDLGVQLIAQLTEMSRQSLQRQLKSHGTTLSAEIAKLKKDRASEYLACTEEPITEIAAALGFRDSTSFSRAFKSWTGASPRDYRKHHSRASTRRAASRRDR